MPSKKKDSRYLTVRLSRQSDEFRRSYPTKNGPKTLLFAKHTATAINDDQIPSLVDDIGAALMVCDEAGKIDDDLTKQVVLEIAEMKIDEAEETKRQPEFTAYQRSVLEQVNAEADAEDEEENPKPAAPKKETPPPKPAEAKK